MAHLIRCNDRALSFLPSQFEVFRVVLTMIGRKTRFEFCQFICVFPDVWCRIYWQSLHIVLLSLLKLTANLVSLCGQQTFTIWQTEVLVTASASV